MARFRSGRLLSTGLVTTALIVCAALPGLAQRDTPAPQSFQTRARFGIDADVLNLQTAVAVAEPHARDKAFSWVRVYFYGFPLSAADVAGLSGGSIEALDRKRSQTSVGAAAMNHSRAVVHLLLDKDGHLSNASLEVPGLTCTILVDESTAASAVQTYTIENDHLRLKAKGTTMCDLTSIGGSKRTMSWDVDVNVPVFVVR